MDEAGLNMEIDVSVDLVSSSFCGVPSQKTYSKYFEDSNFFTA